MTNNVPKTLNSVHGISAVNRAFSKRVCEEHRKVWKSGGKVGSERERERERKVKKQRNKD